MLLRPGRLLSRNKPNPLLIDLYAPLPGALRPQTLRAGLATRRGSNGLVAYEPHNLLIYSAGPYSNWADVGADGGDGAIVDGAQTRRIGAPGRYRQIATTIPSGQAFTVSHYVAAVGGVGATVTIGTNTNGRTPVVMNSLTGVIASGPAGATSTAVTGGWRVDAPYVGDGNSLSALHVTTGTVDLAGWVNHGPPCPYFATLANPYYGGPRIEHDAAGNPLGVLFEGQRVQAGASTIALNASPWANSGSAPTLTADYAVSPDGTVNADRIQFPAADSRRQQAVSITSGQLYTVSGWVRAVAGTAKFRLHGENSAQVSADQTATTTWQRFSYTYTAGATGSYAFGILTSAANDAADLIVWNLGHEAGAFASSDIINPATSGTVTRAKDEAVYTGGAFDAYVPAPATGEVSITFIVPPLVAATYPRIIELSNSDKTRRIGAWVEGGGSVRVGLLNGSWSEANLGAVTAGQTVSLVLCWGANGVWGAINGGSVAGVTASTASSTFNKWSLGMSVDADLHLASPIKSPLVFALSPSLAATPDITAVTTASGDTSFSIASGLQAGDVIIAQAFREGDTTIPSTPSSTWQQIGALAGTGCAARYCYAIATGSSFSSGTFTNATSVHAVALRGVNATHPIGDVLLTESSTASVTLGNLTRWLGTNANCNSKALLMIGHRGSGATLAAPSGFTQQADAAQNNTRVASHLHTSKSASYGGGSIASGVSELSISMAIEILSAKDVVTLGADTLSGHGAFASGTGWNPTGSWSISSGTAQCTASSNAYLEHAGSNSTSKLYKVKLDVSGLTQAMTMGDTSHQLQLDDIAATNRVWQSRPTTTTFTVFNNWSGAATIDNVTAQEISVAPA